MIAVLIIWMGALLMAGSFLHLFKWGGSALMVSSILCVVLGGSMLLADGGAEPEPPRGKYSIKVCSEGDKIAVYTGHADAAFDAGISMSHEMAAKVGRRMIEGWTCQDDI